MDHLTGAQLAWLIPLLPLIGAAISGFFGAKWLKGLSHWPIWLGVGAAAVISLSMLFGVIGLSHQPHGEEGLYTIRHWYTWVQAGRFTADAGAFIDPLTVVMLSVVTGIGFFITVFAAGYMKGEEGYFRFFAYLGLFIFAMTILVLGSNFVMLYLGWEGVGLCSYLLIGYYYERPAAREAAKKAFLVNRVGDFGFGLGIMSIFLVFGSVSFFGDPVSHANAVLKLAASPEFMNGLPAWKQDLARWIPFMLMLGAFGKSAQFPLYVWLPDAMEGPTPVSALIHAATMVTAGVYMIARCSTLFVGNRAAMVTIAFIGAFTALFAATIALRQFDLKKVFAYSTISQLGYMFVGVGILAPSAAIFHLVTHAFFKALLFLSSGVVMHAMLGHLDMRKMSGLYRVLPKTAVLMGIGCAALAGLPPFSGFFSKDEIVGQAMQVNLVLWGVVLFTAFLTAYYTFRLYCRVFLGDLVVPTEPADGHAHGPDDAHGHAAHDTSAHDTSSHVEKAEAGASHAAVETGDVKQSGVDSHLQSSAHHADHGHEEHDHEPMIMILPLVVLAIGALFGGLLNVPGEGLAHFLGQSPSFHLGYQVASARFDHAGGPAVSTALWGQEAANGEKEAGELVPMVIGGLVAAAGIGLAYFLHLLNRGLADRIAERLQPLTGLLEAKYYVDDIYQNAIVEPLRTLGNVFFAVDRFLVDGLVAAVGYVPQLSGFALKLTTQRGYLQGYAAAMLLGLAAILILIFL